MTTRRPKLSVFLGDQQLPYMDMALHRLVCDWLRDEKPDQIVLLGDVLDFGSISTHPSKRGYNAGVDETIEAGREVLNDYANAAGKRCKSKLWTPGNHCVRVDRHLWSHADKVAHLFDNPLPRALHLEQSGFVWVKSPHGGPDYPYSQVQVTPDLTATHGWLVRRGAGASALAHVEALGRSVVHGHTHRQSLIQRTYHQPDGSLRVLTGCESGCLCRTDGLGYAAAPDWAQGFAYAWIHPDQTFTMQLASYTNGTLRYEQNVRRAVEQMADTTLELAA